MAEKARIIKQGSEPDATALPALPWASVSHPLAAGSASSTTPAEVAAQALLCGPLILLGATPDGVVSMINETASSLTGYSRAEFERHNFWQLLYPGELYRQVEDLFERFAQRGDVTNYLMTLLTRDGEQRVISWNSCNRFDDAGRAVEIYGIGIDVTAREHEARALSRAEERLSEVQRVAQIGCWELDMRADRYWFSPEAQKLLADDDGSPPQTYADFLDLLEPSDRSKLDAQFAAAISNHADYDLTFCRGSGGRQRRYLRTRGHVSYDAGGTPVRAFGTVQDITAEVRRDQRLRDTVLEKERLSEYTQHVVNNSPAFIVAIAPDGATTAINDAGCRFLGCTREAILGQDLWKTMYPGKYYDQVPELFREFTRHGGVKNYEMTMCSATGEERILAWTSVNRYDKAGELLEIIGIGQDVTSLRQSSEHLAEVQRIAAIGGWVHDLTTDALIWSDEALAALELTADDVGDTVESWLRLVHPEDRERIERTYPASLEHDEPYTVTYRLRLPDGRVKHMQGRSNNRRDANGAVIRVVGTVQDLTAEVEQSERLQAALKESVRLKEYNEHVVQNSPSMIVATRPDGTVTAMNPAGLRILGCREYHVIGSDLWRLLCPGDKYGQVEEMQRIRREAGRIQNYEITIENVDGHTRVLSWTSVDRLDDSGELIEAVGIATDITDLQRSQGELEYLAHHDPLTGLPNRLLLSARLEQMLARARQSTATGALLYIDLDRFKIINDSLGHTAGDALLKAAAGRLRNCVRASDIVARLGGDEFTLLLSEIGSSQLAVAVARKVLGAFENPFHIEGHEIFVTPSIGISVFPRDGEDIESILRNADSAMYAAKSNGRNGYAMYTRRLTTEAVERVELENELRRALESEQFVVHYQPQVDLESGRLVGAEALVRWDNPERGLVPPNVFIPLAEETGMILAIGEWVLADTCRTVKSWLDNGLALPRVSVNLAGAQIRQPALVRKVGALLQLTGFPVDKLELEVTEGFIMNEAENAIETLDALRELGVRLSIDDFGTGYSSLSYLKRLPIDQLKIDGSFIRDLPADSDDLAITGAIIAMAKSLRLELVAEGVETEGQREALLMHGCRFGQGYLFSPALSAADFVAFAHGPGRLPA